MEIKFKGFVFVVATVYWDGFYVTEVGFELLILFLSPGAGII